MPAHRPFLRHAAAAALAVGLTAGLLPVASAAAVPSATVPSATTRVTDPPVTPSTTDPRAGESVTARVEGVDVAAGTAELSGTIDFVGNGYHQLVFNDSDTWSTYTPGTWSMTVGRLLPGENTISVEMYDDAFHELAHAATLTVVLGAGPGFTATGTRAADGSVIVSGRAPADETVSVSSAIGFRAYGHDPVGADERWSVHIPADLLDETQSIRVDLGDPGRPVRGVPLGTLTGGSPAPAPADLVVATPTPNSSVTAPAGDAPGYPNASVAFSGEGEPGATIAVFRDNGKRGGATTVDDGGHWDAAVDADWVTYPFFTVTQTAGDAVQSTRIANVTIAREPSTALFEVTSPRPDAVAVAEPGDSAAFPNARLHVTGRGVDGASVVVARHNGKAAGRATVADGVWALDADVNWGTWDLSATQSVRGEGQQRIDLPAVTVTNAQDDVPFTVTSPTAGADVTAPAGGGGAFPNARVMFTGTGAPGAQVVVLRAHNQKEAGRGTVAGDGTYRIDADFNWGTWSAIVSERTATGILVIPVDGFTVVR